MISSGLELSIPGKKVRRHVTLTSPFTLTEKAPFSFVSSIKKIEQALERKWRKANPSLCMVGGGVNGGSHCRKQHGGYSC